VFTGGQRADLNGRIRADEQAKHPATRSEHFRKRLGTHARERAGLCEQTGGKEQAQLTEFLATALARQPQPDAKPSRRETKIGTCPGGSGRTRGPGASAAAPGSGDEGIVYRPERCPQCGEALKGEDPAPYRYQVTELPVVKGRGVEHQVQRLVCEHCQTETRGALPVVVAASQFGPQLVSLMAVLMGVYRLSKRQVVRLMAECFQVEIAVGSVVKQQRAVSEALAAPVAEVPAYVQQPTVCSMDETRWRQRGQPKTGWLWVGVTRVVTLFQVALGRSHEVAQALLGATYPGVVGSDRAGSYAWLAVEQRQVCWSHVLRDFQRLLERGGESFGIGTNLKLQGAYLLALWARSRDAPSQRAAFRAELPQIQHLGHAWLSQGAAGSDSQTATTCAHWLALEPALWTFASQPGLEPTNNAAERALRTRLSGGACPTLPIRRTAASLSNASSPPSSPVASSAATALILFVRRLSPIVRGSLLLLFSPLLGMSSSSPREHIQYRRCRSVNLGTVTWTSRPSGSAV
jgi:transposase